MRNPRENGRHRNVRRFHNDLVASPNKDGSIRSSNLGNHVSDLMAQQWSQPKQLSQRGSVVAKCPSRRVGIDLFHGESWERRQGRTFVKCLKVLVPTSICPTRTVNVEAGSCQFAFKIDRAQPKEYREKPTVHRETKAQSVHCIFRWGFVKI